MIFLAQDTINKVALTLNEKCTITGATPYYLFQFEKKDTNEVKLFTGQDISTCTNRYNLFDITLTGASIISSASTENLTAGTINLNAGQYNYTIYSMTGQTNLDITGTTKIVQTGLAYISGTTSANTTYLTTNTESKTYL